MSGNPFPKGTVVRTDPADVSPLASVLDATMTQLDGLIAGQTSRHERAIFAKQVVASIGISLNVYALDASAPSGRTSAAQADEMPDKDADPVGYAKRRIKALQGKGHAIPRPIQLVAEGKAKTWDEASAMDKAERAAKPKPAPTTNGQRRAKRQSLKALTTTRAE